jgi:hypothetical protein
MEHFFRQLNQISQVKKRLDLDRQKDHLKRSVVVPTFRGSLGLRIGKL